MKGYWTPPKIWDGSTAVIIGGGPSLEGTNLKLLEHPRHPSIRVIGCNDAFLLGDWIDVCYFGDWSWYELFEKDLDQFPGLKVTCQERCAHTDCEGILVVRREIRGCFIDGRVGWNMNTGTSAINLAILFGARKVVLVGFDFKLAPITGEPNWHPPRGRAPNAEKIKVWLDHMETLHENIEFFKKRGDLPAAFEVVNASEDTALPFFRRSTLAKEVAA